MKILVTGAKGFIGKNLIAELHNRNYLDIYEYDMDTKPELLKEYCKDCEFIFNLAGVNRPKNPEEFMKGNFEFISEMLNYLKEFHNYCPIMISSSVQATLQNPYGESKKAGEETLRQYSDETGTPVLIYRFPNVFGKWCRPNYNSAVATFCYNISRDLPIQVNDRETVLNLVYIDDVVNELILTMERGGRQDSNGFCMVQPVYEEKLGQIVDLLYSFRESRETKTIPDMTEGGFAKKLYSTYLSYLPPESFAYPLKMNVDERGSFTEIIRTLDRGQFSVNISKPGIIKGNHWHHTKNEKFVVVSGRGLIRFRRIDSEEIIDYHVSGDQIKVVDIPPGYTHSIVNEGNTDLVTFMWCNECFNPDRSDTYFLKVDIDKTH